MGKWLAHESRKFCAGDNLFGDGNQRAGIKYANNDNGEAYRKSTTTRCQVSKTDDVEITEWGNCTKESKNGKFVSEGGRMTCQFKNPNRKKDCVQRAQREIALIILTINNRSPSRVFLILTPKEAKLLKTQKTRKTP